MNQRIASLSALFLSAAVLVGGRARAETLRAADVIGPTNADWIAFARAQKTVREGGTVEFVWEDSPKANYSAIRRSLWLAALHGITNQRGSDDRTRHLMADELAQAKHRLRTPFSLEIALRDVSSADKLLPMQIRAQCACLLIGEKEPSIVPTTLRCQGDEVMVEGSGVVLGSLPMAVTFSQACQTDDGLVFEEDGRVAKDLFVRRFKDGTATVVNMSGTARLGLLFRHDLKMVPFDLPPAGVVHLLRAESLRLSRDCGEDFISGLWKVSFDGNAPTRLVRASLLPTVIGENYAGTIRYSTTAIVPRGGEDLYLHLDTGGAETEVSIDGHSIGTRAWEPFDWMIPSAPHGRSVKIEICLRKRSLVEFIQSAPRWHRH